MKIMIDFKGGPLDGSASLEREPKAGDTLSLLEWAIMTLGATSFFKYNIGHRFLFPSPGWMNRTVVRRGQPEVITAFWYEITDRLEGDGELLLVATFIGQSGGHEGPQSPPPSSRKARPHEQHGDEQPTDPQAGDKGE